MHRKDEASYVSDSCGEEIVVPSIGLAVLSKSTSRTVRSAAAPALFMRRLTKMGKCGYGLNENRGSARTPSENPDMAESWFVYILRCADGSLYTGITNDLNRRCQQHNEGKGARYTRSRCPVVLVYHEVMATKSQALRREAEIKALDRRQKDALVRRAA